MANSNAFRPGDDATVILRKLLNQTIDNGTVSVSIDSLDASGLASDTVLSTRASEATLATRATEATLALVKAKTDNLDAALSTLATEATLALVKAKTDNLDAALSTLATQATLADIKAKTDNLDAALSTRASEATLAAVKTNTDNLDAALSTRASEATLLLIDGLVDDIAGYAQSTKTNTDNLDVAASTRASEATLALVKAKTDNLDAALSTLATQTTLAAVKAKTDNLDAALSTLATQTTLAAVKAKTDNLDVALSSLAQVGGYTALLKITPTVSNGTAYTAGDNVGGKLTLSNAVRTPGTGVLESVNIVDKSGQSAALDVFIFDADPSAATLTDNSAADLSTDSPKVIAHIAVADTDYVAVGSQSVATVRGLGLAVKPASGTTLYAAVVTSGTPTYGSTSAVVISFGILQD